MKAADLSSEKKVLSNILHGHLDYTRLFADLPEQSFTTEKTKILYKVLKTYYLENSELPTTSIVKRKLKQELKKIRKQGKEKSYIIFINKLLRMKKYKQAHIDFFYGELIRYLKIRKQFDMMEAVSEMLEDGKDPDLISNYMSKQILDTVSDNKSVRMIDYRDSLKDRVKEVRKRRREGGKGVGTIYTGIDSLDKEIGGVDLGEILIIAGATGRGKSILLEHITAYNILNDRKVVHFTNEMKAEQVAFRIDSNLTEIKHRKFERANLSKIQTKKWRADVKSLVKSGQLKIVEIYQGCSTLDIENTLRKYKLKPDVLIVDYAQRMSPSFTNKSTSELDWMSIGSVVRELKNLALRLPVPLVTAVQLKPKAVNKEKLVLDDIALSTTIIDSEADILVGIILTDKMKLLGQGILQILKARQGAEKEMLPFKPNYNFIRIDNVEE